MELRQVRYALRVQETLHFGKAAALEHIAPSVLSSQIQKLEIELGVILFARNARSVTVTSAGRSFLEEARVHAESLEALRHGMRLAAGRTTPKLRVGIFGEALGELTHLLFTTFSARYPDVELSFTELFMNNQIDMLRERQVDASFVRLPVDDPDIEITPLYSEPTHVAVSSRSRLAAFEQLEVDQIIDMPFAVAAGGTPTAWSSFWSLDDQRGSQSLIGAQVTTLFESFSTVAYSNVVDTVPASAARTISHPGVLFRPATGLASSTLAFASHRDSQNSAVSGLRECAIDVVRDRINLLRDAAPLV